MMVGAGLMQAVLDPTVKKIHKAEQGIATVSGGLNNEFMLLPLLGFREAAAGLLWVRCDEFFHSGDYDAILTVLYGQDKIYTQEFLFSIAPSE